MDIVSQRPVIHVLFAGASLHRFQGGVQKVKVSEERKKLSCLFDALQVVLSILRGDLVTSISTRLTTADLNQCGS